ncbi:kinesin-like protein KIF15 [Mercenaria mercenaria]|uniref:kinesin-like protein KIF15 n=1 Tax=Mercenaria mercenaria TaxID=6596 RepID=UPI00234F02AB|nr:kinesin-like protein KIF15 [Mercenaria mercenaria]
MATDTGQGDGGDNNIQVFVRIRPPGPDEPAYTRVVDVDPNNSQIILRQEPNPRVFAFDYVADTDSKQETIFSVLGKKVIENCITGYNGTIFAYGQTGSGKTFTMMGPSEDADNFQHELRGVIPRSFEYLYNLIAREKELHGDSKEFLCKCSFLEIYNEQIFDLLEPSSNSLHLRESLKTGVYVSGLSEQVVADASEAYEVLSSSWMNRKVASTAMNRESSRSHAVFTLQIESKEYKGGLENIKTSSLNLVDLAGSERQKDTGASGLRLKEAGSINKSLSNLGNVIMSLVSAARDGKKRFIPYRDSKLTFLLRDSLGGNAKTSLIACVHPGHKCFGETLSTLLFAKRAKMIKNKAVLNENSLGNIKQLQAEMKVLREELNQYKMGLIPQQPAIAPAESMPVLRQMFLQAMMLRQLAESEKQELHVRVEKLRELCEKRDKAIQTNKMIIKFRDNNIKRLEGKTKEVKETREEDLLKELEVLRTQNEHHPGVAALSGEVHRLKKLVKNLQEDSGVLVNVHEDSQKVRQLEEEFHKLIAEQNNKDEKPITPQRVDVVSTATIEKMRSQIEQLQEELTICKQAAEKQELLSKNEIESFKKYVAELEMVISANNMRTKLEKAAINEMHRQTVMTITTPKKERYRLRNRTVVAPSDTPDLDTTIPFENEGSPAEAPPEEEGILAEDVPEEVEQQAQEALLDQIKHLQEKNMDMETRLSEYETERVKQLHQQTVLESQLSSIEELLDKERITVSSLREELNQAEPKLKAANEERENAVGETRDLRLLLAQADKELKENKEKMKLVKAENDKYIEGVESKFAQFALALEQMEKKEEKLNEENESLLYSLEAEKGTRQFFEDHALKLELTKKENELKIKELENNLQIAEQTLLEEKDMRESMEGQLSCEGNEKERKMLKTCEENKQLQIEFHSLQNMLDAHTHSAATLRQALDDRDIKIQNLEKNLKGIEDKLMQSYQRIEEQSGNITELKEIVESAEEQIAFYKEKEEVLARKIEKLEAGLKAKDDELAVEKEIHTVEIETLNVEAKNCQDNLEIVQDECTRLTEQLEDKKLTNNKLRKEVDRLTDLLNTKEEANAKLSSTSLELAELTEKWSQLESAHMERINENAQLKAKLDVVDNVNKSIGNELECLKAEKHSLTEKLECQSSELSQLLMRCNAAEVRTKKGEVELSEAQYRLMELDRNLAEMTRENEELRQMEARLKTLAEKDNAEKTRQKVELDTMKTKLGDLFKCFDVAEEEEFRFDDLVLKVQTMKEDNEKLVVENINLVGHSNHKQKIKYHENLKHENCGLKKEIETLRLKNRHLEDEVKEIKKQVQMSDIKHMKVGAVPLKENIVPQHKAFLSGDFTQRSPHYSTVQHKDKKK